LKFKRLRVSSSFAGPSPQGVIDMKVENEFRHVSIITVYMPKNISQGEKFSKCYEVRMTLQWAKGNSQSK
jgi:hypothetical protein